MGSWPILPSLPQEQRDKGAGTERLVSRPAALPMAASHTGLAGLPQRQRSGPQATNYKLVQGGKGWRRCLQAQEEIPALSGMGPERAPGPGRRAPGWEGEACMSSHSRGGVQWAAASLSLPLPHRSAKGLGWIPSKGTPDSTLTMACVNTW